VGIGAGVVEVAADGERRVGPAVLQRDGEHRRRGGLAVGAGDGHAAPADHRRGEGSGARDDRQAEPYGLDDLGIARPDRRGDNHGVGSPTLSPRLPSCTLAPSARSETTSRLSLRSLPLTGIPRAR
jgi:hypothetical protein